MSFPPFESKATVIITSSSDLEHPTSKNNPIKNNTIPLFIL
jgi:hypothetical protein